MTFKTKDYYRQNNGCKGGRPKQDSEIYIKIPDIKQVNITPKQYETLLKKYGDKILQKALLILDNWLNSGSPQAEKYIGKNHYSHFRSDGQIINTAKRVTGLTLVNRFIN